MRQHTASVTSLVFLVSCLPAHAWWVKGHAAITEGAALRMPDDLPAFFRSSGKQLGFLAGDPDRWKNPEARHLKAAESPDHYIDLEDYEGNDLPADRFKAIDLLSRRLRKRPERTGMLPYALMEHFDRLSVAFYDYRQVLDREKNAKDQDRAQIEAEKKAIEMKCITFAGVLSHYTGDTAMPLHTTIHYDGRMDKKGPDGKKLQVGIHAKIDAFPEQHGLTPEEIARGVEAKAIDFSSPDRVWKHVLGVIHESYKHIDRCYELDAAGAIDKPTPESRQFILERCRTGAQFTVDLWYTAWKRSATLPPPY